MLTLGIDDAGRGPIIGDMFLAGVILDKNAEEVLKKAGVKDSKKLTHKRRIELAEMIKEVAEDYHVVSASPELIDEAIIGGINLNTLEALKTSEIINQIAKEKMKVIVDCPSTNVNAWKKTLMGHVKVKELDLYCEHKADANHVSVSAASILAKVAREESISKLKNKYGDFGSGYPSDPVTKEFLQKKSKSLANEGLFRKSWATWKNLTGESQKKLF